MRSNVCSTESALSVPLSKVWMRPSSTVLRSFTRCNSVSQTTRRRWHQTWPRKVSAAHVYSGAICTVDNELMHTDCRLVACGSDQRLVQPGLVPAVYLVTRANARHIAAPYICCALVGCWLTEPMNKLWGRRGTVFISCLISAATCFGQSFANNWWQMFIARFFLGLGIGPKSATTRE